MLGLAACVRTPPEVAMEDAVGGDTSVQNETLPSHFVLSGGVVVGQGEVDVVVRDGVIEAVGPSLSAPYVVDVRGAWLTPSFIDSHVHLAYLPRAEELLDGGLAGAVDWAAPETAIGSDQDALDVVWSGPMVTVPGGYPTQGWGAAGFGTECASVEEVRAAVGRLVDAGADVIKVPVDGTLVFAPEVLTALVEEAHQRGAKVGAHALRAEGVARAAEAGVDILVHLPTEPMLAGSAEAFEAFIPTLGAFGIREASVTNVTALLEGGALALYGTDFGNARVAAISETELERMAAVGLDPEAILASGTSAPAEYFGFDDLGAIAPGKAASLLVLAEDPLVEPLTLARPLRVMNRGDWR